MEERDKKTGIDNKQESKDNRKSNLKIFKVSKIDRRDDFGS